MLVKIEMVEEEIRGAIVEYIKRQYGVDVSIQDLEIEVKSKQNYKSEWERAAIRVNASVRAVEKDI